MNELVRNADLQLVNSAAASHRGTTTPWPNVTWQRVVSDLCVATGVAALVIAVLALRFTLVDQSIVDAGIAPAIAVIAAAVGVVAFVAATRLRERADTLRR